MQGTDEYLSIPLDKGRLALFALLSIVLVASSAWLYLNPDQGRYDPGFLEWIALAGIAFFGFGGVFCLTKLFDDRPGLILDQLGLIDNSSTVEAGRIVWSEIRDIKVYARRHRRFLVLVVGNPERYFARGNLLTRFIARANHRMIGSPIAISPGVLEIRFSELEQSIRQFWSKFRTGNATGLRARPTNTPQFGKVRTTYSRAPAPVRRDWPTAGEFLELSAQLIRRVVEAQWVRRIVEARWIRGVVEAQWVRRIVEPQWVRRIAEAARAKIAALPLPTKRPRADANEGVAASPAQPSANAAVDEITDEVP